MATPAVPPVVRGAEAEANAWVQTWQAGCWFWFNELTGEATTTCPNDALPRAPDAEAAELRVTSKAMTEYARGTGAPVYEDSDYKVGGWSRRPRARQAEERERSVRVRTAGGDGGVPLLPPRHPARVGGTEPNHARRLGQSRASFAPHRADSCAVVP